MNEKIGIQNLLTALIEKNGLNNKEAETFIKEFFQLIVEALENEKYVKIKGLGTFKLIDVDSRESVNVNTGERIEIRSHTKISFTPDNALRDVINRPFAHFETVILNENALLDNTSVENVNEEDSLDTAEDLQTNEDDITSTVDNKMLEESPSTTDKILPTEVQQQMSDGKQAEGFSMPAKQQFPHESQESLQDSQQAEQDFQEPQPTPVNQEADESADKSAQNNAVSISEAKTNEEKKDINNEERKNVTNEGEDITGHETEVEVSDSHNQPSKQKPTISYKVFITIITLIITICLGCIVYLYWPATEYENESAPTNQSAETPTTDLSEPEVTNIPTDTLHATDTASDNNAVISNKQPPIEEKAALQSAASVQASKATVSQDKPAQKKKAVAFAPDSVGYEIVGTETNYTIKDGETLTRISLRFWGTKSLWPYLVKHNSDIIKDPDNVPYGTTIKIPKLKKK